MDHQGAQSQYNYDPRNNGLSRRATDEAASSSTSLAPYDRTNYPPRSSTDPGDQNQPVAKPKRSGKICGKCGEGLTGQFVRALGDTYHLECFTCHVRHPRYFLDWRSWAYARLLISSDASARIAVLDGLLPIVSSAIILYIASLITMLTCYLGLR